MIFSFLASEMVFIYATRSGSFFLFYSNAGNVPRWNSERPANGSDWVLAPLWTGEISPFSVHSYRNSIRERKLSTAASQLLVAGLPLLVGSRSTSDSRRCWARERERKKK